MPLRRLPVSCFCVLGVWLAGAAGAAFAQSVEKPAADWIRSAEPVKRAWAAYWAAEQNWSFLIPALENEVAAAEPPGASPRELQEFQAAKLAAMDALIQLHAEMPAESLESAARSHPNMALILAAKAFGDIEQILLPMTDPEHYDLGRFVASGNLLTARRSKAFARQLLERISVQANLIVYSPNQPEMGSGFSRCGGVGTIKGTPIWDGWPPVASYDLTDGPAEGAVLLAPGRHPIYYTRVANRLYSDGGFHTSKTPIDVGANALLQEYLAEYLGQDPKQLPLQVDISATLRVASDSDYVQQIQSFAAYQRRLYKAVVESMAAQGYIGANDAQALQLKLHIQVTDLREGSHGPLPEAAV